MQPIESKLDSPFQKEIRRLKRGDNEQLQIEISKEWQSYGGTVSQVRASDGLPVKSFRELVDRVAMVAINNT